MSHQIKDLFCLILFVLYVAAMGCISAYAIYSGGASRLIYGMDSFGNICGQKNQPVGSHSYHGLDMTNRKFVYFFDFTAEAAELVSRNFFRIKFFPIFKSYLHLSWRLKFGLLKSGWKLNFLNLLWNARNKSKMKFFNLFLKS